MLPTISLSSSSDFLLSPTHCPPFCMSLFTIITQCCEKNVRFFGLGVVKAFQYNGEVISKLKDSEKTYRLIGLFHCKFAVDFQWVFASYTQSIMVRVLNKIMLMPLISCFTYFSLFTINNETILYSKKYWYNIQTHKKLFETQRKCPLVHHLNLEIKCCLTEVYLLKVKSIASDIFIYATM